MLYGTKYNTKYQFAMKYPGPTAVSGCPGTKNPAVAGFECRAARLVRGSGPVSGRLLVLPHDRLTLVGLAALTGLVGVSLDLHVGEQAHAGHEQGEGGDEPAEWRHGASPLSVGN